MYKLLKSKQAHVLSIQQALAKLQRIEWPTVWLFMLAYAGWILCTLFISKGLIAAYVATALLLTLHSSLQHEAIHGHPTPWMLFNTALASIPIGLLIPFERFKSSHLIHHRNWLLTDPYEDTESYFLSQAQWQKKPYFIKRILVINNTLIGRLLLGPFIMISTFYWQEVKAIRENQLSVRKHWIQHLLCATPVIIWLTWLEISLLQYLLLGVVPAISLLQLRAFSEHLPAEKVALRSAIIPSCRFMSLLFLNNNYHQIHHNEPALAWYKIPDQYWQNRKTCVHNPVYEPLFIPGYWQLFKHYAFKSQFPVPHPILHTQEHLGK